MAERTGLLLVIAAATLWSTIGVATQSVPGAMELSPDLYGFARTVIAGPILLALAWMTRRERWCLPCGSGPAGFWSLPCPVSCSSFAFFAALPWSACPLQGRHYTAIAKGIRIALLLKREFCGVYAARTVDGQNQCQICATGNCRIRHQAKPGQAKDHPHDGQDFPAPFDLAGWHAMIAVSLFLSPGTTSWPCLKFQRRGMIRCGDP